MPESPDYLFVYGTLRQGNTNGMCNVLNRYADFVGEAAFQGKLYLIDDYPGAVPSNHQDDRVQGEVYRLNESELVLTALDNYEEFGLGFKVPTEYVREIHPVRFCSGEMIPAWIYLYHWPTDGLRRILSGDFLKDGVS